MAAAHAQLMAMLGEAPQVEFGDGLFGKAARATKDQHGRSWGVSIDFSEVDRLLANATKEISLGTMTAEAHSGPVPDASQVAEDISTAFAAAMEATAKAVDSDDDEPGGGPGAIYPLQYLGMNGGQPVFQHVVGSTPESGLLPTPDGGLALRNPYGGLLPALMLPYTLLPCSTVNQRSSRRVLGVVMIVASLVLSAYPRCRSLFLHALGGGLECECEIGFVRTVLRGLGFECYCDGSFVAERKSTAFMWRKQRPGGTEPLSVTLTVHHDPDDIDVDSICTEIHPYAANATAPNLHRVAAVSAPAADSRLFVALAKAVEQMKERVDDPMQGGCRIDQGFRA